MTGKRPIVGITADTQLARFRAWELPAALVPLMYIEAVERSGGRVLVVPPTTDGVAETLDVLEGIVFSGGGDLDPAIYGEQPHPATDTPQRERDAAETALLLAALERDMPVLAICRGAQLFNVVRGGGLVQHLPEMTGHDGHKERPGTFSTHEIIAAPGSRLAAILGDRATVHSHHHQGIDQVGEGLVETAWAADGTPEGVEDPSRRFAVGVLWHPEASDERALFEALVEAARDYRRGT